MPNLDKALDFTGIRYYLSVAADRLLPDDAATRADLEEVRRIAGTAFHFKGAVPTFGDLPKTGNQIGDVWNIGVDEHGFPDLAGENVAWTGDGWDSMGSFAVASLVPKDKFPPLMSPEDWMKLSPPRVSGGIAPYAKRVQVDSQLDRGEDGKEIALLNASVTMYAEGGNASGSVMGSGSTYSPDPGTGKASCTFYVPKESVLDGETIRINVVARTPDGVRLVAVDETGAMNYAPSSQTTKTFSDLPLVNPDVGADDDADYGTISGTWSAPAARPGEYRLVLSWNGGAMYMLVGRKDGGPVGVNFTNLRPGVPKVIAFDLAGVQEGDSTAVKVSAKLTPTAGVSGFIGAELAPIEEDVLDEENFPLKCTSRTEYNVTLYEDWTGSPSPIGIGHAAMTWVRVDDEQGLASFVWCLPGIYADQPMTLSVSNGAGGGVLNSGSFVIRPYVPSVLDVSTTIAEGEEPNELLYLEMDATPAAGFDKRVVHAGLNPDAEGVSFDGSTLDADGAYAAFKGLIPYVKWQEPDEEHEDGHAGEIWGTFNVRWIRLRARRSEDGTAIVGHDYACAVTWYPAVPHAWRVLQNARIAEELSSLLGPNDSATSELNGVMTAADKIKLDAIEAGANVTVVPNPETGVNVVKVDSALNGASPNPLQTVKVYEEVNLKIGRSDYAWSGWMSGDAIASSGASGASEVLLDGTVRGSDLAKLMTVESGARAYPQATYETMGLVYVDEGLSSASTNPVRTAAALEAVDGLKTETDGLMRRDAVDQTVEGVKTFSRTIIGNVSGSALVAQNASTASKAASASSLASARTIFLSGGLTGSALFGGLPNSCRWSALQPDADPMSAPYSYKGAVASADDLPSSGAVVNDVWSISGTSPVEYHVCTSAALVIEATLSGGVPPASAGEEHAVLCAGESGAVEWAVPGSDRYLTKTGDQTVYGIKDFRGNGGLITAAPDMDGQAAPTFYVKDMLRAEVERRSENRNTIVRGADGSIHYMVVVPKFKCEDLSPNDCWGLGSGVHPAFLVTENNVQREVPEILVGKYLVSTVDGKSLHTLPKRTPYSADDVPTITAAMVANGPGLRFQINTALNWGAAALLGLRKRCADIQYPNADFPGNTDRGRSHLKPWQTGVLATLGASVPGTGTAPDCSTLTGTGPSDWTHDGTPWGICDMVGNRAEMVIGAAEFTASNKYAIRIAPDNSLMLAGSSIEDAKYFGYLNADGSIGEASALVYYWYNSAGGPSGSGGYLVQSVQPSGSAGTSGTNPLRPFDEMSFATSFISNGSTIYGPDLQDALKVLRRTGSYPVSGLTGGGLARISLASYAMMFRGGCGNPNDAFAGPGGLFSMLGMTTAGGTSVRGMPCIKGLRLAYLP